MPDSELEMVDFLKAQLDQLAEQAATMRASSAAGQWAGIDPAEVAAGLEQEVEAGRRAVHLYERGRLSVLAVKLWAMAFANRPGYRDEWRPS